LARDENGTNQPPENAFSEKNKRKNGLSSAATWIFSVHEGKVKIEIKSVLTNSNSTTEEVRSWTPIKKIKRT
jgi:hypothetical protein